jgi:hypothetical protein
MHRVSFFTLGFGLLLLSSAGVSMAQERFALSADGQEVTDSRTGLIWRRCAEGMVFKGKTCTGQALYLNHPDASARAKAASTPEAEWRMPILKELSSIVSAREAEENKAAIDPNAFPATPVARFWTSSSTGPGYFTFVGFSDGSAGEAPRATSAAVRLVRGGK